MPRRAVGTSMLVELLGAKRFGAFVGCATQCIRHVGVGRGLEVRRWLVPRSASGTSALFEHCNSGVG
ncbi:hypothetical protein LF1_53360 [Rubripirellula obstinata]|uniref:Uncharacterized protein n=1 Tax=Rubripirellula obstinata TaxID=406547 RepID=A0A5B1C8P9_9BACT|nr:hypothetical protein LF1_53360 [Rubripirellula obstinata]